MQSLAVAASARVSRPDCAEHSKNCAGGAEPLLEVLTDEGRRFGCGSITSRSQSASIETFRLLILGETFFGVVTFGGEAFFGDGFFGEVLAAAWVFGFALVLDLGVAIGLALGAMVTTMICFSKVAGN